MASITTSACRWGGLGASWPGKAGSPEGAPEAPASTRPPTAFSLQGSPPAQRQDHGSSHHPTWPPVLHWEQPGRLPEGQRCCHLPQALSFLSGNPELARRCQQGEPLRACGFWARLESCEKCPGWGDALGGTAPGRLWGHGAPWCHHTHTQQCSLPLCSLTSPALCSCPGRNTTTLPGSALALPEERGQFLLQEGVSISSRFPQKPCRSQMLLWSCPKTRLESFFSLSVLFTL